MKKTMFDDKYSLTKAVLKGWKTMTRRIISREKYPLLYSWQQNRLRFEILGNDTLRVWYKAEPQSLRTVDHFDIRIPLQIGDVVAVAQSLWDMGYDPRDTKHKSGAIWGLDHTPAWTNKMFVSASECIHQIRITGVRVERLQDISDEDCIREGIEEDSPYYWVPVNMSLPNWRKIVEGVSDMYPNDRDGKAYPHFWDSPRKAFAALIDKISGKGTWERNPWVFVYEFELVK